MKTVAQTVIEADRFYTIAAHTGNVIQAVEASKDGGTVRLGKYDHKPEQEWSFVRVGEGVYRIRNRASGKLLDLTMTGTANGTWLHLWEDVGGTSQMWELCPTPEGTVRLRSSWAGGNVVRWQPPAERAGNDELHPRHRIRKDVPRIRHQPLFIRAQHKPHTRPLCGLYQQLRPIQYSPRTRQ